LKIQKHQESTLKKTFGNEHVHSIVFLIFFLTLTGIWCSGRQSCKSMYIQLKLLKRQDLISQIKYLFKSQSDQIILNIEFERDDIDNYVFCLSNRKLANHLQQDYQDLANYCVEKKSVDKYGLESSKYVLLNEISEIPNLILDSRVCAFLNKYSDLLDYLIVSDQHVGMKSATQQGQDDQTVQPVNQSTGEVDVGLPNAKSNMILCFSVPGKGSLYWIFSYWPQAFHRSFICFICL
jgi:hypothetical protein